MTGTDADVDVAELESYLAAALGVEVTGTEVLSDKLNLIVAVSTERDENAYVLHRPNELRDTCLFNDPKREYEILSRLRDTPIAAQDPVLFCDDESIAGDRFFVTTYLEGETIPLGIDLPERFRNAGSRGRVADRLVETLAGIHSLEVEPFEEVCEHRSPLDQVNCGIERLDEARSATGRELPRLRAVGDWLRRTAPSDPETTVVHGDFRPGNVLLAGTDRPEIVGVLDWETAMLGDPLTEVGYLLLRWRDDGDPTPSLDGLEAKYPEADAIQQMRKVNENGLCPFSAEPGSPSRRELVARYEDATGIAYERDRFYRAHAAFMLATVWEDLHREQIEAGAASDFAPWVDYMALLAEGIVNGEC